MRHRLTIAALAALPIAVAAVLIPATVTAAAPTELAPGCQHAVISENSGNGPNLQVVICYALRRPDDGHEWMLVNDGAGRLDAGDTVLGYQMPGDAR
jgi:hypothetical protein